MTQRLLQLNQRGRSVVLLLVALNSIYTIFSTFEKALTDCDRTRYIFRYLWIICQSIKFKTLKKDPDKGLFYWWRRRGDLFDNQIKNFLRN